MSRRRRQAKRQIVDDPIYGLKSVSKFLIREPYFEGRNTEQLLEFFETIIDDRPITQRMKEDEYIPNTLEQFLT